MTESIRTLGELVCTVAANAELTGEMWSRRPNKKFLAWPPDSFAVAATVLRESGAYVQVLRDWPPAFNVGGRRKNFIQVVRGVGRKQWRPQAAKLFQQAFDLSSDVPHLPETVLDWWRSVWKERDLPLATIGHAPSVWQSLVCICAAADEASHGMGIPRLSTQHPRSYKLADEQVLEAAFWLLSRFDGDEEFEGSEESVVRSSSSLCDAISASRATVLPKMIVPQTGITLRSLTHHLALLPNGELNAGWTQTVPESQDRFAEGINLLFFPWPMQVDPIQFQPADCNAFYQPRREVYDRMFAFFTYEHRRPSDQQIDQTVEVCREARRRIGKIDGVVFPEMSLDVESFDLIRNRLVLEEKLDVYFIVGGIFQRQESENPAINAAKVWWQAPFEDCELELLQHKHHRWLVDAHQIRQYGMGVSLNPSCRWWEYIDVPPRSLQFVALDNWLTLSVLICEDLARPDPVADAIRAIGPNLVIALLQDGPQLTTRWSARYATVLADDPGCAVLTVTGLGMAQLSRTPDNKPPSRVVALWKQADGVTREIELPDGADALVLCLSRHWEHQWTVDGRHDDGLTGRITLAGVHPIKAS